LCGVPACVENAGSGRSRQTGRVRVASDSDGGRVPRAARGGHGGAGSAGVRGVPESGYWDCQHRQKKTRRRSDRRSAASRMRAEPRGRKLRFEERRVSQRSAEHGPRPAARAPGEGRQGGYLAERPEPVPTRAYNAAASHWDSVRERAFSCRSSLRYAGRDGSRGQLRCARTGGDARWTQAARARVGNSGGAGPRE